MGMVARRAALSECGGHTQRRRAIAAACCAASLAPAQCRRTSLSRWPLGCLTVIILMIWFRMMNTFTGITCAQSATRKDATRIGIIKANTACMRIDYNILARAERLCVAERVSQAGLAAPARTSRTLRTSIYSTRASKSSSSFDASESKRIRGLDSDCADAVAIACAAWQSTGAVSAALSGGVACRPFSAPLLPAALCSKLEGVSFWTAAVVEDTCRGITVDTPACPGSYCPSARWTSKLRADRRDATLTTVSSLDCQLGS